MLYTAYAGAISESSRYETRNTAYTKKWEQFKPFTPSEWYQENKTLLKQYKIPITQAKTLYEPKEAYSTKPKTTYGKTNTIPYLSERTGNNNTKLSMLEKELYDSCSVESKSNVPNVPINNKEAGKLDIMSRISSIAGGSLMTYIGVGAVIAGVSALTIATGGLALPAIAAALTGGMGATAFVASAVAVGTIASGAGLAAMGVNEVAYGATGENLLLDTVFKGNTNLYSNTQLVLTMGTVAGSQYSSTYSYKETVFRNELEKTSNVAVKSGGYAPSRELPRTKHGDPIPDTNAPHTQLGKRTDNGITYNQGRTWELNPNGKGVTATKDYDFSDHGTTDIHPNPHQHPLTPANPKLAPKGGYHRGTAEPLDY